MKRNCLKATEGGFPQQLLDNGKVKFSFSQLEK